MKAKVVKTGEIVDVYHESQHGQITNIYKESVLVNGRMWSEDELNFCVKANEAPEKIYVSNYNSGLTYNWHNEQLAVNDIEYTRTDAFIEKACEWLKESITNNPECNRIISKKGVITMGLLIDEFRKYMEGE